jgi:hypothetical protein
MSTETLVYRGRTYRRHALSALFPIIVGEEFESLKASITENGLRQPILLAAEGSDEVLDGWNRLRGCIETDSEARFEHAVADADLIKISLDLNLSRRHLTAGQKAMIAAEIANMYSGFRVDRAPIEPEPLRIAQSFEVSDHQPRPDPDEVPSQGALARDDDGGGGEALTPEEIHAAPGHAAVIALEPQQPLVSLGQAAERLGIARSTAALGRRIAAQGDESVKDAVRSGAIALNEAGELLKQPKDAQRAHMEKRLAEGRTETDKTKLFNKSKDKLVALLKDCKPLPLGCAQVQAEAAKFTYVQSVFASFNAAVFWASPRRNLFSEEDRGRIEIIISALREAFNAAESDVDSTSRTNR